MEKEFSYGIIPIRFFQGQTQCFLVQLRSGHHWGFPKGHQDSINEDSKETAQRELSEETNLKVSKYLNDNSFVETYSLERDGKAVDKRVEYFLAEVNGLVELQTEEIFAAGWFELSEAKEKITYQASKLVCQQVIEFFKTLS